MQDSMAHPHVGASVETESWKTFSAWTCAILLAALFLVAGVWKSTDPFGASARLAQARAPGWIALPGAVLLGAGEVFCGILLLIPRFRRWGAILTGLMLVFFMGWVGYFYNELRGEECQCFPFIKRAVGPGFFISDALMLLFAWLAYKWSKPSEGMRTAAMILAGVAVFSAASYGVAHTQNNGVKAPDSVMVDGKTTPLNLGRVFLYFYDPECSHCDDAAKRMATHKWNEVKILGVPTRMPQFGQEFMQSTKLNAPNTSDVEILKKTFPFGDPPFGVALENGRQKVSVLIFDKTEPEQTLRRLGYIE